VWSPRAEEPIEGAHIYPWSMGKRAADESTNHFWCALRNVWSEQKINAWRKEVTVPKGTEPCTSLITLCSNVHGLWGKGGSSWRSWRSLFHLVAILIFPTKQGRFSLGIRRKDVAKTDSQRCLSNALRPRLPPMPRGACGRALPPLLLLLFPVLVLRLLWVSPS
jgi:hypothetical protein